MLPMAQHMTPTPPLTLEDLDAFQGVPQSVLDLLPYLSKYQRAYLILRPTCPSRNEAARQAGVDTESVYSWRSRVVGFKEAEAAVVDAKGDAALQLSRALAKGAMPSITQRQITQALRDDQGLVGQQLMAQQRAREHVSRLSGIEDAPPSNDPVGSLLAELATLAALHAQRKLTITPSVTTEERVERMLQGGGPT